MRKLMEWYIRFKTSEKGATAVEYAILVALIAVVVITAVTAMGEQLGDVFDYVTGKLAGVATS
jgi:pilus assembly protein Flp/PilA